MARIRSALHGEVLRVKVSGRLRITDMGRLEHACAPALISHAANLELDLRRVTYIDATATAVLERISQRGARIARSLHIEIEKPPTSQ
jgi:anti-anti-sigma regulatory factor